ncbi:uncharacterized protein LOC113865325 [Abrus precatorius]|uniref:Uncharacterized protein LOC113865325 n=1 Tax=Abrus precatorius TaxID=3816 RepID=A0A8B8LGU5_ABRPR|nr:uncharacterized protein LOC113865325 [Abrus precatorius]
MEVVLPSPNGSPTKDPFDFNRARISPYLSAPSSPKRFGEYYYLSAPTSPSRFYSEFDYFSATPFDWEEHKPDTPKDNGDDGFAFFVSGESGNSSRSAEELFDGGKIKPLNEEELLESAKSPLLSKGQPRRSSPIAQGKKAIREALSPRKKKESSDEGLSGERRGRERSVNSSNSGRRVARSLSPYRISHYTWDEETHQAQTNKEDSVPVPNAPSLSSTSSKSSRKWRLRDLLLFRSASEGRGSSKDPFRKFSAMYKKPEEAKASTTRLPSDIPKVRRKEPVSAHELHYARKKAESEDLKKRTFLPYKQGILGRLAGFGR